MKGSNSVAQLLDEITMASKEQTQGIDQITGGLEQIDEVTQSNTASAEESASSAEELASQAQQLQAMISQFKLRGRNAGLLTAPNTGQRRQAQDQERREARRQLEASADRTGAGREYQRPQQGGAHQAAQGKPQGGGTAGQARPQAGASKRPQQTGPEEETGIAPVNPKEVIKLDDDDFDQF